MSNRIEEDVVCVEYLGEQDGQKKWKVIGVADDAVFDDETEAWRTCARRAASQARHWEKKHNDLSEMVVEREEDATDTAGLLADVCDIAFEDEDRAANHAYDGIKERVLLLVDAAKLAKIKKDECREVTAQLSKVAQELEASKVMLGQQQEFIEDLRAAANKYHRRAQLMESAVEEKAREAKDNGGGFGRKLANAYVIQLSEQLAEAHKEINELYSQIATLRGEGIEKPPCLMIPPLETLTPDDMARFLVKAHTHNVELHDALEVALGRLRELGDTTLNEAPEETNEKGEN